MYVIRAVMQCRPGQVRPMVEKFKQVADAIEAANRPGIGSVRVSTDVAGGAFWTAVLETETESLDGWHAFEQEMLRDEALSAVFADYHELVAGGRREIWRRER